MSASTIVVFAQKRFFYGWLIVAVAFTSLTISQGYMGWIISVLLKPMAEDFGWTRAVTIWPSTIGGIAGGLIAPLVGRLLDRHGAKPIMAFGTIAVGATLIGLSQINSFWQFALLYSFGLALNIATITNMTPATAIANWFIRKRGRAIAISSLGISFGGILLVPVAEYFNLTFGWRSAWLAIGIITWAVLLVPVLLIMKRRPEDVGLRPDGDTMVLDQTVAASQIKPIKGGRYRTDVNWGLKDALKTRAFWLILLGLSAGSLPLMAVLVHIPAYLTDNGIPPTAAASVVGLYAVVGLFGKFFWGLAAERIPVRYCIIISVLLAASGLVILTFKPTITTAYLATLLYGTNAGAVLTLQSIIWPDYFGRLSVGAIRGFAQPLQMVFNAGGPLLAAWLYDTTGGYTIAFSIFLATMLVEVLMIFFARPPRSPVHLSLTPV